MHHTAFLHDLAVVMIVAAIVTIVFRQLKQPVVLGYILAGLIIGPYTPPYALIEDKKTVETLSELGVIFLLFSLGLEFSLRKLKEVGATAIIAASMEIVLMVWLGYQLGRYFGWGTMDSVFLGAILSISSTTIIIKALEELGKTKESFASLIFGILIIEDILAILMIALLSGFATTGSLGIKELGTTVMHLSAFLGVLLVGGLIVVPRLLNYVSKFKSNEMLLITVLGLCFGVSLLAVQLGYSVALGAFLIGAIIAEARQILKIENLMHPMRDMFSAVFFVSIGLLIDPAVLWQYAGPILMITVMVVVGKVFSCSLGTFVCGHNERTSLRVGMGLAQIGEFSFIIAQLGLTYNVTSKFLYPIAVAVSALTTLFTPYLIRASDPFVAWFDRAAPRTWVGHLEGYTRWIGQLGGRRQGMAWRFLRKWAWQITLNFLLVAGVFIAAAAMRGRTYAWWPDAPGGENGLKAMLWLAAMLLSLPLLIASVRKLEAMGMLISEISVTREAAGRSTEAYRGMVRNTVVVFGCILFLLVVLMLSSTILPSWRAFLACALVVVIASLVLRRSFVRIYSKAQAALKETFEQPPEPSPTSHAAQIIPPMMREAKLRTILITESSPFAGRLIGEIKLRTKCGASVVGIERDNDESVINPGSDEELRIGDRVLLLGSEEQLTGAEALMTSAQ